MWAYLDKNFPKTPKSNLPCMEGGNFTVDKSGFEKFLAVFCNYRNKWTAKSRYVSYVWRPPKLDQLPLYVDLDLRYDKPGEQPFEQMRCWADQTGLGSYIMVAKPRLYEKKKGVWAGGCHLYFDKRFPLNPLRSGSYICNFLEL